MASANTWSLAVSFLRPKEKKRREKKKKNLPLLINNDIHRTRGPASPRLSLPSFTHPEPSRSFIGSLLNLDSLEGDMVNSSFLYLFTPVLNRALPGDRTKKQKKLFVCLFVPSSLTTIYPSCFAAYSSTQGIRWAVQNKYYNQSNIRHPVIEGMLRFSWPPSSFLCYQEPRAFPFSYSS